MRAEKWFSCLKSDSSAIPLLISPLFSKRNGLKQVDFAQIYSSSNIILWEVKSCWKNTELALSRGIKHTELLQWRKTAYILSNLLKKKIEVRVAVIKYQNGFNFVKNHKLV